MIVFAELIIVKHNITGSLLTRFWDILLILILETIDQYARYTLNFKSCSMINRKFDNKALEQVVLGRNFYNSIVVSCYNDWQTILLYQFNNLQLYFVNNKDHLEKLKTNLNCQLFTLVPIVVSQSGNKKKKTAVQIVVSAAAALRDI